MSSRAVKKQLNSLTAPTPEIAKTQSLQAKKQRKQQKKANLKKEEPNTSSVRSKALRYLKRTAAPSNESLELMNKVLEKLSKKK